MRLLANPVFMRMALLFVLGSGAFVAAVIIMRALRRRIIEDPTVPDNLGQEDTLYPYTAVIQQLKQQKFELQNERQMQQRRAKAYELMAAAVIANLPCGILFIAPNGLVKQSNVAARRILGFASPLGMSLESILRNATAILESGASLPVAEAFRTALQDQVRNSFEASYCTPSGEDRILRFLLVPLNAAPTEAAGVACVITDESATADSRRARILHSEISAEMALQLRGSIAIIREYAGQILAATAGQKVAYLAEDISAEAERLNKVVGGFLAGSAEAATATAGA